MGPAATTTDTPPAWRRRLALGVGFVVGIVATALLVRETWHGLVYVPTPSMSPWLRPGDVVLVDRAAYGIWLPGRDAPVARWRRPARGDAVLVRRPDGELWIKRVVAVGGDEVAVHGGLVERDATAVPHREAGEMTGHGLRCRPARYRSVVETHGATDVVVWLDRGAGSVEREAAAQRLPPDTVFLLGDHRDASFDSRRVGPVPIDDVVGRIVGPVWRDDPCSVR